MKPFDQLYEVLHICEDSCEEMRDLFLDGDEIGDAVYVARMFAELGACVRIARYLTAGIEKTHEPKAVDHISDIPF